MIMYISVFADSVHMALALIFLLKSLVLIMIVTTTMATTDPTGSIISLTPRLGHTSVSNVGQTCVKTRQRFREMVAGYLAGKLTSQIFSLCHAHLAVFNLSKFDFIAKKRGD